MSTLVESLVSEGLISAERLAEAETLASASYSPLASILVQQGFVDEGGFLRLYGRLHGMEFVSLREVTIDASAARSISAKLASHYHVMPLRRAPGGITIAVSDPLDLRAAEDIETNLGMRVERVLACRADIETALQHYYGVGADTVERILAQSPEREVDIPVEESLDIEQQAADASVVRLVNQLLKDAIKDRATDIHFEAHRAGVVVRRRIDGVLYDTRVASRMRTLYPSIVSRIKLMAGLNIVERRLPQDGRARVAIERKNYDLRVSIVPAMHGEDIVIRILPSTMLFDLGELGFSGDHLSMLGKMIESPHGILFVTGPTGSGKSTTLYSALNYLRDPRKNITTVEDPVEYRLRGINQIQVKPEIDLDFASCLRAILRQDPDIIFIGEIRDKETVEIAIKASLTGHLVLSTFHTNDAPSAISRLAYMGIERYLLASTLNLVMAQRLVRRVCERCKQETELTEDLLRRLRISAEQAAGATFYKGAGCAYCNGVGYLGRAPVFEFMPLDHELREMVVEGASEAQVRKAMREKGYTGLLESGVSRLMGGVTSAEEVLAVTFTEDVSV